MRVLTLREHLALHKLARFEAAPSRHLSLSSLLQGLLWCCRLVDRLSVSYTRHLQELPSSTAASLTIIRAAVHSASGGGLAPAPGEPP